MPRPVNPKAHRARPRELALVACRAQRDLGRVGARSSGMRRLSLFVAALSLTPVASSSWVTFQTDGVRIRHPSSWHATSRPLTPVTSPLQLMAVASFAFPENPRANGCRPVGTLARKQPAGVVLLFTDYGDWPPGQLPAEARGPPLRTRRTSSFTRSKATSALGAATSFASERLGGTFRSSSPSAAEPGPQCAAPSFASSIASAPRRR